MLDVSLVLRLLKQRGGSSLCTDPRAAHCSYAAGDGTAKRPNHSYNTGDDCSQALIHTDIM
ncbi:hypothetical protein ACM01_22270 [Streptomyces viridochromogenes]|uniref:Uncharacterized protein n=1 Tax=Streptomyces viridochromogenes TaxID=1938 RepID=A0A0J7ZAA6_STRVR|nr:hypothetical protein [Streptomyces viridochromogenes]KMS72754.1 hypothetical protein ACM01_22270 [Streptomyces viridochromogenes]KOG08531.1 hypothetical protein ADK35_41590 [Streptomyces viridochromogenes]KOG09293.1 hypothetical protein ADK36_41555 [Streptomyces viridochromogenes]